MLLDLAINNYCAFMYDRVHRTMPTRDLIAKSFEKAQRQVQAFRAVREIGQPLVTHIDFPTVEVHEFDGYGKPVFDEDGKPKMISVTADVNAAPIGLPFGHPMTQAFIKGRLQLGYALPAKSAKTAWPADWQDEARKTAAEMGVEARFNKATPPAYVQPQQSQGIPPELVKSLIAKYGGMS